MITYPMQGSGGGSSEAAMFSVLEFFGHSGTEGGAEKALSGTDDRLANMLHADDWNFTKGGAILCKHEANPYSATGNGGWAHVLNTLKPGNAPPLGVTGVTGPYEAERDFVSLWFGNNDLGYLGPGAKLLPFLNALEMSISIARAAWSAGPAHASVTYPSGAWQDIQAIGPGRVIYGLDTNLKYSPNGSVRITVPNDVKPGSKIALMFVSANGGDGALWNLVNDGVGIGQVDSRNQSAVPHRLDSPAFGNTDAVAPVIKRLTVDPGDVITATMAVIQDNGYFAGWWIEAETPPLVIVPMGITPRDDNYGIWTNWPYGPAQGLGNADRLDMNARIQGVVDSFADPDNVITVPDPLGGNPDYYYPTDTVHSNDRGHWRRAVAWYEAIVAKNRSKNKNAAGAIKPPFVSGRPSTSERNVVQAANPQTVAATFKAAKGEDGGAALAHVANFLCSGLADYSIVGFGRLAVEGQIGFASLDAQFVTGTKAGDFIIRLLDGQKNIRMIVGNQSWVVSSAAAFGFGNYINLGHGKSGSWAIAQRDDGETRLNMNEFPLVFVDGSHGNVGKMLWGADYFGLQHYAAIRAMIAGNSVGDVILSADPGQKVRVKHGPVGTEDTYSLHPDDLLPWHHHINPSGPGDVEVGGWQIIAFTNQAPNFVRYNGGTNALNDSISWDQAMAKGTYSIEVTYWKNTNQGIVSVYLDNVLLGTFDEYAAAQTFTQKATFSGAVIANTGKKRVTLKVTSKNASASAYGINLSHLNIRRTA